MIDKKQFYQKIKHNLFNLQRGTLCSTMKMERDKKIGIFYLSDQERKPYEITIHKGLIYQQNQSFHVTHYFLFALDEHNQFYGKLGFEWKNYGRGFFGHGSFKASGYLKTAGEMIIVDGKLKYITSNSGHYLPSARHLRMALFQLMKQGVDVSETIVVLYRHQYSPPERGHYHSADFYRAPEFLNKHETDCMKYNDRASEFKAEIKMARDKTNNMIGEANTIENNLPHRRAASA